MTMRQSDAVVALVKAALEESGKLEELGSTPASELLTDEQKASIKASIVDGLTDGSIEMSESSRKKYFGGGGNIKNYSCGLLTNHVRKHKELNCGVAYVPANPGSRKGSQDPQIKELKKLLAVVSADEALSHKAPAIQEAINNRLAELQAEKAKNVVIDLDKIPEHLRDLVIGASE